MKTGVDSTFLYEKSRGGDRSLLCGSLVDHLLVGQTPSYPSIVIKTTHYRLLTI